MSEQNEENELELFYEKYQNEIDEDWCISQTEHYGFDVTEWAAWDECPPDDFVADLMEKAKSNAEGNL